MKTTLAIAALSFSALSACTLERAYVDPNANNVFGGGGEDFGGAGVAVQGASMRGDIGPIRAFDGPATGYGTDDADFGSSQLTLDAQNDRGTGLVMLYLDQSIHDMPAGETRLTGSNDNIGGTYVQLCSDSNDSSIHFDGVAEEVVITITERDTGARDVNIDATITEGYDGSSYDNAAPTLVSSRFTVAR